MIFDRQHPPIVQQILASLANEPESWCYDKISGDLVNRTLGVDFRDINSRFNLKILIRSRGWLAFSSFSSKAIWNGISEWFNRDISEGRKNNLEKVEVSSLIQGDLISQELDRNNKDVIAFEENRNNKTNQAI